MKREDFTVKSADVESMGWSVYHGSRWMGYAPNERQAHEQINILVDVYWMGHRAALLAARKALGMHQ